MAITGSQMVCSIAHLEHEKCLNSDILSQEPWSQTALSSILKQ